MSLPALHLRNQQAVVKMVEAKGLSLRGPKGAVAISGRHCRNGKGIADRIRRKVGNSVGR